MWAGSGACITLPSHIFDSYGQPHAGQNKVHALLPLFLCYVNFCPPPPFQCVCFPPSPYPPVSPCHSPNFFLPLILSFFPSFSVPYVFPSSDPLITSPQPTHSYLQIYSSPLVTSNPRCPRTSPQISRDLSWRSTRRRGAVERP